MRKCCIVYRFYVNCCTKQTNLNGGSSGVLNTQTNKRMGKRFWKELNKCHRINTHKKDSLGGWAQHENDMTKFMRTNRK